MKRFILTFPVVFGLIVLPGAAFGAENVPARDLAFGMRGEEVVWLQEFLIAKDTGAAAKALGAVGATGYFGERTRAAVAEFQSARGVMPAEGYFGPKTRNVAAAEAALPAPTFEGTVEAVDTGCFADGVCSVTISGKEVIVLTGMRINPPPVGKLLGVDSIGDLENRIGSHARVYAATATDDGADYTLYGSTSYYVDVAPLIPTEGKVSVRGTIGCLPPKYTDRPTIMMCAIGLKGEDGNYYALTGDVAGDTGSEVTVSGTFSKTESETWKSVGTIDVKSVTEVK